MSIRCCYGCVPPRRTHECHGTCKDYIDEKAADEEKKAAEDMRRKVNNSIYQQRTDMVAKALRRHGRK